ncbi:uncharacterized protein [Venturia canescens]|uniref:uncharacterized protein n=1 Tax=Venturia canescens TaxID=32260 RepID=UPI001C9C3AE5|nr:uncharacterized protein LOC122412813 [Venturia canescens]XP_043278623.1 uncharacterized protein LOC122412813 [Venturia canescens]
MYGNHCFTEKLSVAKHNNDYDVCNTEMGQKFFVQWSPQNGPCYLSRNKYASPRSLSKSVPGRNRTLVRYNINRSLNFEIGGTRGRANSYKSQNSSSNSSFSADNDHHLSRSAKILRALNIDYSPLKSTGSATRRINKSLNFDLSPSPKKIMSIGRIPHNRSVPNSISPLPKINKTLNFDTSSGESSINSRVDSSVESIDENQNQTPSQRNKKAKKSLDYQSPNFTSTNLASPILGAPLPSLRSGLRNKINSILQSTTPHSQLLRRNSMKNRSDEFGASTPRNLYNDFQDEEDECMHSVAQNNDRSQTPENFIKIVPESMSAIKKSHKKERVLGRREKSMVYQSETCSGSELLIDTEMNLVRDENGPKTPSSTPYESPQCGHINSIKQSHKKNKSRGRSFLANSEDEMSETGSIFSYTNEEEVPENSFENENVLIDVMNSAEKVNSDVDGIAMLPEDVEDGKQAQEEKTDTANSSTEQTSDYENLSTPVKTAGTPVPRPGTPENRINFLQRIMTDSIKKSHKKLKDTNKKSLFKSRAFRPEDEENENSRATTSNDVVEDNRAATPENTNSSRLLLSQYSSVKKSHRKDKHKRMLSGSLQRKKFFGQETDSAWNSDSETHNSSVSSSIDDFVSLSPSQNFSDLGKAPNTTNLNDPSEKRCLESNGCEWGVSALPDSDSYKSSPNKRKNTSDDASSAIFQSSSMQPSTSATYESAEEEFKIFTPIKKRKSLNLVTPVARRICDDDFSLECNKLPEDPLPQSTNSRCSTPTTAGPSSFTVITNTPKTNSRQENGTFIPITNNSTPIIPSRKRPGNDNCGRVTPQDQPTSVLMVDINSIKKSHKKDKRGNISRRSLMCAQDDENESAACGTSLERDNSPSSRSADNQRASTSYKSANDSSGIEASNENECKVQTPPNCLGAKNFLKLLQTESIKRSHKKVRDRKKFEPVVNCELSNDGSIFDESERSINIESEAFNESSNETFTDTDGSYITGNFTSVTECVENSYQNKGRYLRSASRRCARGKLSNDDISDPEEKLCNP